MVRGIAERREEHDLQHTNPILKLFLSKIKASLGKRNVSADATNLPLAVHQDAHVFRLEKFEDAFVQPMQPVFEQMFGPCGICHGRECAT